ncbi:unnamed protein product [Sphagnum tenellum]
MKHIIASLLASTVLASTAFATEPDNQTHIWPTGTVLMADGVFQAFAQAAANLTGNICFTAVNIPLGANLSSIVIPGNVTVRVGLYAPSNGSTGPGTLDWDLGVTSYSATTGLSSANFPGGSYNGGSGGIHWIATLAPSSNTPFPAVSASLMNGGVTSSTSFAASQINGNSQNFPPSALGNTLCTPYSYGALPMTPPTVSYNNNVLNSSETLLVGLYH